MRVDLTEAIFEKVLTYSKDPEAAQIYIETLIAASDTFLRTPGLERLAVDFEHQRPLKAPITTASKAVWPHARIFELAIALNMNKAAKFLLEFFVCHDSLPEEKRKLVYYCALIAGMDNNNKEMVDFILDIRLFSLTPNMTIFIIKEKLLDRAIHPNTIGFDFARPLLLHGAYAPCEVKSPELLKQMKAAKNLSKAQKASFDNDEAQLVSSFSRALIHDKTFVDDYLKKHIEFANKQAMGSRDPNNYSHLLGFLRCYHFMLDGLPRKNSEKYGDLNTFQQDILAPLLAYNCESEIPVDLKLFKSYEEKDGFFKKSAATPLVEIGTVLGDAFAKMPLITSTLNGSAESSANEPSLAKNSAALMPSPRTSNRVSEEKVVDVALNDNSSEAVKTALGN